MSVTVVNHGGAPPPPQARVDEWGQLELILHTSRARDLLDRAERMLDVGWDADLEQDMQADLDHAVACARGALSALTRIEARIRQSD